MLLALGLNNLCFHFLPTKCTPVLLCVCDINSLVLSNIGFFSGPK